MFLVIRKTNLIAILGMMLSSSAFADIGVTFSSGSGIHGITPYRVAVSWDFGTLWREEEMWGLKVQLESSYGMWDGPTRPDLASHRPTDLYAFTSGPILRWQRLEPFPFGKISPYAELGVGLSWLSQREIQGRMLSLHFQFEDKGGVGVRFGRHQQYDFAMRAYHYSNASIKRPNSGVNLFMASFGYWFTK